MVPLWNSENRFGSGSSFFVISVSVMAFILQKIQKVRLNRIEDMAFQKTFTPVLGLLYDFY